MRVRLKADVCGPRGVFREGEIVSSAMMPEDQLKHLVARDYADLVGQPEPERAVVSVPELAALRVGQSSWYELPDGRRVQGKAKAQKALEEATWRPQ